MAYLMQTFEVPARISKEELIVENLEKETPVPPAFQISMWSLQQLKPIAFPFNP
jgi:hypothetical protein